MAPAVLSAVLPRTKSSMLKSVAPTSTGGPGSSTTKGSSMGIFTRSMSSTPCPKKRSDEPCALATRGTNSEPNVSAQPSSNASAATRMPRG
jgi:hypothetical protein